MKQNGESKPLHDCSNGRPELAWENCSCGHFYVVHEDDDTEVEVAYARRLHVSSALPDGVHLDVELWAGEDEGRIGAGINLTSDEARGLCDHFVTILDRQEKRVVMAVAKGGIRAR